MRLRNPYAKMPDGKAAPEWRGAWGNAAADWQDNPGVAAQLGGRPRDGSFWMALDDFYRGFNKVHVCRLAPAPAWQVERVAGEWTTETAGGELNALPGSRWRTNPQYRLRVGRDTAAVIAVAQPDAQLDKNEASDSYPHEVGFFLFHEAAAAGGAAPPRRKLVVEPELVAACPRLACTRQVCQEVYLQAGVEYTLMPCTKEAYVTLAYTLTVATAAGAGAELLELPPEPSLSLRGAWSDRSSPPTAGGCPNNPETWTLNPQFLLTVAAPMTLTGVLCLELDAARAADMQREQAQYAAEAANVRAAGGDEQTAAAMEQQALALAPAIGWVLMRCDTAEMGGLIRGSYDHAQAQQVGNSQFSHGTQEVVAEVELGVGTYTLIPSTFEARHEAPFALTLYHSAPSALQVTPLVGGQAVSGDAGRPGAARPQGPTGPPPSGSGKNHMAPPAAKYDVAEVRSQQAATRRAAGGGRSETEDDGKMGYAERMEMEEAGAAGQVAGERAHDDHRGAAALGHVQEVGQGPDRRRARAVRRDGAQVRGPGLPAAAAQLEPGRLPRDGRQRAERRAAAGLRQRGGRAGAGHAGRDALAAARGDGDAQRAGALQERLGGRGHHPEPAPRQPLVHLGAQHRRGQPRASSTGCSCASCQYKDKGFFVLKFYRDDPLSDDDWAVVLVDDRIPCDASGLAAFCRNQDPSVYWAMIVEKAYAKLSGSYEAMQGGTVVQGLEDLTGGVGYKFDLGEGREGREGVGAAQGRDAGAAVGRDHGEDEDGARRRLRQQHQGAAQAQDGPRRASLLNRAYAVVTGGEFERTSCSSCACRSTAGRAQEYHPPEPDPPDPPRPAQPPTLRRAQEWNGAWSDGSSKWNSRMKQMLSYGARGGRRLLLDRVRRLLQALQQGVHVRACSTTCGRASRSSRAGWTRPPAAAPTSSAGGNNNQWLIHIRRPATKLIIKLTQPDARKKAGNGRHYSNALGFYIFKGNRQRRRPVPAQARAQGGRRGGGRRLRLHVASRASRASRRSRTPSNPNPEP